MGGDSAATGRRASRSRWTSWWRACRRWTGPGSPAFHTGAANSAAMITLRCGRPPVILQEPHVRREESPGPPRPAGTALVDRHFEGRLPGAPGKKPGKPSVRTRLYQRGPVAGRLDPRPFLKIWEPRYRKFLEVVGELHAQMEGEDARAAAESLREQFEADPSITRHGPVSSHVIIEKNAANPRRKPRPRRDQERTEAARRRAGRARAVRPGWPSCWWATIPLPKSTFATKSRPATISASTPRPHAARYHHHRRTAGHRRAVERAPRYRRHPGAAAAAAAGGQQAHSAGRRARQGRGRLSSLQRRQPGGRPARPARLHSGRHHRDC